MIRNGSGIRPFRNCLLLLPKQIDEKSEGGIIMATGKELEREQLAQSEGVVVAMGEAVFTGWGFDITDRPKIGDTVVFTKYAGMVRKGDDGLQYRLILDEDVRAIGSKG